MTIVTVITLSKPNAQTLCNFKSISVTLAFFLEKKKKKKTDIKTEALFLFA